MTRQETEDNNHIVVNSTKYTNDPVYQKEIDNKLIEQLKNK